MGASKTARMRKASRQNPAMLDLRWFFWNSWSGATPRILQDISEQSRKSLLPPFQPRLLHALPQSRSGGTRSRASGPRKQLRHSNRSPHSTKSTKKHTMVKIFNTRIRSMQQGKHEQQPTLPSFLQTKTMNDCCDRSFRALSEDPETRKRHWLNTQKRQCEQCELIFCDMCPRDNQRTQLPIV